MGILVSEPIHDFFSIPLSRLSRKSVFSIIVFGVIVPGRISPSDSPRPPFMGEEGQCRYTPQLIASSELAS